MRAACPKEARAILSRKPLLPRRAARLQLAGGSERKKRHARFLRTCSAATHKGNNQQRPSTTNNQGRLGP
eukprot:7893338-Alexandrium_andersonii.AAC.1